MCRVIQTWHDKDYLVLGAGHASQEIKLLHLCAGGEADGGWGVQEGQHGGGHGW